MWSATRAELERRKRAPLAATSVASRRAKHLLSGLIRCSTCGSNYTISGKDYYRCAGEKERGTCGNKLSVRKGPLEVATLATLQSHLLTEEHAKLFVEEFRREAARLAKSDERHDELAEARLRQVESELATLSQNLTVQFSPTLMTMLLEREAEKAQLEARLAFLGKPKTMAEVLPHPVLLERFTRKVEALRVSLDDDSVRTEAAAVLATLIESVTIYPAADHGAEAEVVAKVADLLIWATNDNAAPKGGVCSSITVVAGTGFEPVTFRL
ncbi:recombinase zinc beta ribbon domain-containing protein [Sphingomonas sp. MMS24-J13]|uniref:recombinase zinc beta ribbon domain-containing protein n=1 Tax=Sphingomonas sp. MMS24-J13 TaxID=3238686 RepID=UPI003850FB32